MASLKDLDSVPVRSDAGNFIFNSAAIAAGTTTGTFKTTATLNYVIDGVFKSKAATDNIALTGLTVLDSTPWNTSGHFSCFFVVGIDTSGNFVVSQGQPFVATADANGKYRGAIPFQKADGTVRYEPAAALTANTASFLPEDNSAVAVLGVIKVTTAGSNFVPGTTTLASAGFTNCVAIPASTNL